MSPRSSYHWEQNPSAGAAAVTRLIIPSPPNIWHIVHTPPRHTLCFSFFFHICAVVRASIQGHVRQHPRGSQRKSEISAAGRLGEGGNLVLWRIGGQWGPCSFVWDVLLICARKIPTAVFPSYSEADWVFGQRSRHPLHGKTA